MFRNIFIILPILLGFTQLSVTWTQKSKGIITFHVTEHDPMMMECEKSGSDVYYRYEYQLCRRRSFWLDSCDDTVVITRSLTWDPISDNYSVISDMLGDDAPAVTATFTSRKEAIEELSTVKDVSLRSFAKRDPELRKKYYLRARMKFICKGQTSATLDRLSSIMTLGLVSVGTADSGWIDFQLAPD